LQTEHCEKIGKPKSDAHHNMETIADAQPLKLQNATTRKGTRIANIKPQHQKAKPLQMEWYPTE